MTLLKKKLAPDLAAEIGRFQVQLDEFIDEKTRDLKASAAGRDQPFVMLRRMLMRNHSCLCAAALTILANEQK